MAEEESCCSCAKVLVDSTEYNFVNFRYEIPGSEDKMAVLWAVVCTQCANDAQNKEKFPVIEALINARIIRIEHKDTTFTPKSYLE